MLPTKPVSKKSKVKMFAKDNRKKMKLTYLSSDLVSALSGLDVNDFAHLGRFFLTFLRLKKYTSLFVFD